MIKHFIAAAIAAALIAVPTMPGQAQTAQTTTKPAAAQTEKKPAKTLTAQQQKMKDCAAKWKDEKVARKVKGRAAYNKFMSGCLKG